jgi:hypothetical protein
MDFLEANGTRLADVESGPRDAEAFLLSHSLFFSHAMFNPLVALLTPRDTGQSPSTIAVRVTARRRPTGTTRRWTISRCRKVLRTFMFPVSGAFAIASFGCYSRTSPHDLSKRGIFKVGQPGTPLRVRVKQVQQTR